MEADGARVSRNTRRKQRNRGRLIEAARLVMSRKGIDAATIAEITEAADLALGTFYNYFESKDAILDAVISESTERLGRELDVLTAEVGDAAVVLATAVRHSLRMAEEDPIWAGFVVRNELAWQKLSEHLGHRAERDIHRGMQRGRFHVRDPKAALTALAGVIIAGIRGKLEASPAASNEGLVTCALQMLGVSPEDAAEVVARPLPALEAAPRPGD